MRLLLESTPRGHRYHVVRASHRFPALLLELVREARRDGLPLTITSRECGDPGVLVVGPLGSDSDRAFRHRWADFIG